VTKIVLPSSWPLAENYIGHSLEETKKRFGLLDLPQLIREAYAAAPAGTLRALRRKGALAGAVAAALNALPHDPAEPATQQDLFAAAAYRAIWLEREMVPAALARLQNLAPASLDAVRPRLTTYGSVQRGEVPDVVVALLLLTAWGARRFPPSVDLRSTDWLAFADLWDAWLQRANFDMQYVPEMILEPLQTAFNSLCAAMFAGLWAIPSPGALVVEAELIDRRIRLGFAQPVIFGIEPLLPSPAPADDVLTHLRIIYSCLWTIRSYFKRLDQPNLLIILNLETIAKSSLDWLAAHDMEAAEARLRARLLFGLIVCQAYLSAYESDLMPYLAELRSLAEANHRDPAIQRELADALFDMTAFHNRHNRWDEAMSYARDADKIAESLLDNADIIYEAAKAWVSMMIAANKSHAHTEDLETIFQRVKQLMNVEACHSLARAQLILIEATQYFLISVREQPSQAKMMETMATTTQKIAGRFPDHAGITDDVAWCWVQVAHLRAFRRDPAYRAKDIARYIERIAKPFPDHKELQRARAFCWKHAAWASSYLIEERSKTETLARHVERITNCFPIGLRDMQDVRAEAWKFVAFARCHMPELRAKTAEIVPIVADIIAPFLEDDVDSQRHLAETWRHVAYARCQLPSQRHLAADAAAEIQKIALRCPNVQVYQELAKAWLYVAYARSQLSTQRHLVADAVAEIRKISLLYPDTQIYDELHKAEKFLPETPATATDSTQTAVTYQQSQIETYSLNVNLPPSTSTS
jgi:hypothetical protein